jgi:hypothetical protein
MDLRHMTPRERRLRAESVAREARRGEVIRGAQGAPREGPLASHLVPRAVPFVGTARRDDATHRDIQADAWYLTWFGSQGPTGKLGFVPRPLPADFPLVAPGLDPVAIDSLTLQPYAVRWRDQGDNGAHHVRMFAHRDHAVSFARGRKRSAVYHLTPKTRKVAGADQVLTRSDPRSARDAGPRKGAGMVVSGQSSRTMSHYVIVGVEETRIWYT